MKKIRMGVIGVGSISGVHIKGIKNSPDAELAAICDIDEGMLKNKGDKHGVPKNHRFKSHLDLLKCPDVDAVSICTPNVFHFPIAADAVRYNKPFALEKPVTMVYEEAVKLQEMAAEKAIPNIVCFSYRFKSAVRFARDLIRTGQLGEIVHFYGKYVSGKGMNQPLVWRYQKNMTGYGVLGDRGSHLIDLARFLVGDMTKLSSHAGTIIHKRKLTTGDGYGESAVDDYCDILGELEGGASAVLSVSRFVFARDNYQRIEISGSKGGLIYMLDDGDEGISEGIKVCIGEVYEKSGSYKQIRVPKQYDSDQMQSFFDLINGRGSELTPTIADGVINQRVLDAAAESFENEKWVHLK